MIDTKDVLLVESAEQNPIEFLRRGEVVTERFFNDDASTTSAACLGELFHDELEKGRWDGEVMRRPLRRAELLADGLEGSHVFVIAVDVPQQAAQLVECRRIDPCTVFLDAVSCPRPELIDIPTCLGYSNNRHIKVSVFHHRLKCRKDFLVG